MAALFGWCLMSAFVPDGQPPALSEFVFAPEVRTFWKEQPKERRRVQMRFSNVLSAAELKANASPAMVEALEKNFRERTRPVLDRLDDLKAKGNVGVIGYVDPINQSWSVELDATAAAALQQLFAERGYHVRVLPDDVKVFTMGDEKQMRSVVVAVNDPKTLTGLLSGGFPINVERVEGGYAYGRCRESVYQRLKNANLLAAPPTSKKGPEVRTPAVEGPPTKGKTFEELLKEERNKKNAQKG